MIQSEKTIAKEKAIALAAQGKPMAEICEQTGLTPSLLWQWQSNDAQFRAEFLQARDTGLHLLADSLLTLPDTGDVLRARLKSENIRWLLARRLHRVYGDKLDVSVSGQLDIATTLTEARARIQHIKDVETIDLSDEPDIFE